MDIFLRSYQYPIQIVDRIIFDEKYRQSFLSWLNDALSKSRQNYDGMFETNLLPSEVKKELKSGGLSLYVSLLLTNPFSVLKLERHFELAETGSAKLFVENWNKEFC